MSASFAEGLVGIVLDDRYRLDAVLGEGGMGAVYRAHHLAMDRKVAVKLLKPHLNSDDTALQRFTREARSTMKVDSDHAVKVLDFGITPHGDYYMVLEYLDGRTVQRELDIDGPFSPQRTVHVAKQVLQALRAAHDKGLIHRDIKPDNILLMRIAADPDFAKVLDFGVAKLMDGAARSSKSALAITQAGMVFGTPEFMSPEQACGQPIDGRSDLYSLAATMFAMLTGCGMYKAKAPIEWLMHHARTPPPHLADGLRSLAPFTALDAALQKCLAKRRDERPQTAAQMIELLDSIEASLSSGKPAGAPIGAPARAVFSPSSYIEAIDPNATLLPDAAGATDPNSTVTPARIVPTDTWPTTTGGVAQVAGPWRGLWLGLGGTAILAVIVATAIIAMRRRTHDAELAKKKQLDATAAHVERQPVVAQGVAGANVANSANGVTVANGANGVTVANGANGANGVTVANGANNSTVANGANNSNNSSVATTATASGPAGDSLAAHDPVHAGTKAHANTGTKASASTASTRAPANAGTKTSAKPRIDPEVAAHLAAAEAAQRAGNRLRQLAEADAALQGDPRNVRARLLFADALIASGDLDRGCKHLRDLGRNPTAVGRARQAGCPTN